MKARKKWELRLECLAIEREMDKHRQTLVQAGLVLAEDLDDPDGVMWDASGLYEKWEALLTLPREAVMALAALEAGCYVHKTDSGWIRRVVEGAVPEVFPTMTKALAAAAEALGLEPWTGREQR